MERSLGAASFWVAGVSKLFTNIVQFLFNHVPYVGGYPLPYAGMSTNWSLYSF